MASITNNDGHAIYRLCSLEEIDTPYVIGSSSILAVSVNSLWNQMIELKNICKNHQNKKEKGLKICKAIPKLAFTSFVSGCSISLLYFEFYSCPK
ncbi:MAG: hypothetical protein H0W88_11815 [Parachlamydiaceae bacterium]|nr:hypothetical protein [Parachlamydiaceae bacterium]